MKVAVLGCGAMGSRLVKRLLATGHEVTVWNRDAGRLTVLVAEGATAALTPADAASGADVVITMVADDLALRAVSEGADGLCAGITSGSCVIQMSTVSPSAVQRLSDVVPLGVELLDAPVLGSLAEVESGALTIFVGGSQELLDRMEPALSSLGTAIRVGELGAGTAAKLVANSTLLGCLAVLGESISLAHRMGLSSDTTFEVLETTPLAAQSARRREALETGTFPPRFSLNLAHKDAQLVSAAATGNALDLRVASAVESWLRSGEEAGLGGADYSSLLSYIIGRT
ncbi:MAG TPA: NAD(P)-dependent oxidoreductase [Actinomycetes bacterium]|nr:NAD(P)-dependent oxidoreductase [Actinomycetes bacterium]